MIDLVVEDERWQVLDLEDIGARALRLALDHAQVAGAWEISVLVCDDARISALNESFRGKAKPTNILSWPAQSLAPASPGMAPPKPKQDAEMFLGDMALAFETVQREADEASLSLTDHVTHLMLHGALHLLGFDHETDEDAQLMENIETTALASIGISNPY